MHAKKVNGYCSDKLRILTCCRYENYYIFDVVPRSWDGIEDRDNVSASEYPNLYGLYGIKIDNSGKMSSPSFYVRLDDLDKKCEMLDISQYLSEEDNDFIAKLHSRN